jgi:DNA repair protein RadC
VSPRDTLRVAVREGAHGVLFVHNHPSGDPSASPDDADLTERLRAASDLVGILARYHVIVAVPTSTASVVAALAVHALGLAGAQTAERRAREP